MTTNVSALEAAVTEAGFLYDNCALGPLQQADVIKRVREAMGVLPPLPTEPPATPPPTEPPAPPPGVMQENLDKVSGTATTGPAPTLRSRR